MSEFEPGCSISSKAAAGRRLRARREAAGLTLRKFATLNGYSASYLSRVESGRRGATPAVERVYAALPTGGTAPAKTADSGPVVAHRIPRQASGGMTAPGRAESAAPWFGAEVRRLRMEAGKSLRTLGDEVFLSRSQLGKVEQGDARGSFKLALALESALGAQGQLTGLLVQERARIGPAAPDPDILARGGPESPAGRGRDPEEHAASASDSLATLRIFGHQSGPHAIVSGLRDGVVELYNAAGRPGTGPAHQVWPVMLRYAELLGWIAQETGQPGTGLRWTRTFAEWAAALGDADAVAYSLVRQSQWARRRGDAAMAVELARRAGAVPGISVRIAGYAAQREAQASALAGDERAFRLALERYQLQVAEAARNGGPGARSTVVPGGRTLPVWGPAPDPAFESSSLFEATCLIDLAEFRTAMELFDQGMPRLATGRTGYARLAVRHAIAAASVGEPEYACQIAAAALPTLSRQGSGSLRGDLRLMVRVLNRHRHSPSVRALLPDLTAVARGAFPTDRRPASAPTTQR